MTDPFATVLGKERGLGLPAPEPYTWRSLHAQDTGELHGPVTIKELCSNEQELVFNSRLENIYKSLTDEDWQYWREVNYDGLLSMTRHFWHDWSMSFWWIQTPEEQPIS